MKPPRVWHPVLLGLIPIGSAFVDNVHEVGARELVLPVALILVVTLAAWALLARVLKDAVKAALAVSAFLVVFLNFDAADEYFRVLGGNDSARIAFLRSAVVLLAEIALVVVGLRALFKRPRAVRGLTSFLNVFSAVAAAVLLALLVRETGAAAAGGASAGHGLQPAAAGESGGEDAGAVFATAAHPARLPDIYYIVLDAYGRSDELREIYGYDNRGFLDRLKGQGFFVASRSTSNYCQTLLSLGSSLNCRYHDRLAGSKSPGYVLGPAIRRNAVLQTLKAHGYRFVSFASGFAATEFPEADAYRSPFPPEAAPPPPRSEFQSLLLEKTPFRLTWKEHDCCGQETTTVGDPFTAGRQRVLHVLENLGNVAAGEPSPKFVFAHVMCPHPPFLFGANGADVSPHGRPYILTDGSYYDGFYGQVLDYVRGYRGQAEFVTGLVERAVGEVLKNSPEPPIIIIQGDHGPGSRWNANSPDPEKSDTQERLSILNAYYLPNGGDRELYDDISPVNSFRVIFNHYFGAKLNLLPDESYLSTMHRPFQFVNVSARVRKPPGRDAAAR